MGNSSSSSSSSSICFSPSLPVCDFSASHLLSCSWIKRGKLMSSTIITKNKSQQGTTWNSEQIIAELKSDISCITSALTCRAQPTTQQLDYWLHHVQSLTNSPALTSTIMKVLVFSCSLSCLKRGAHTKTVYKETKQRKPYVFLSWGELFL